MQVPVVVQHLQTGAQLDPDLDGWLDAEAFVLWFLQQFLQTQPVLLQNDELEPCLCDSGADYFGEAWQVVFFNVKEYLNLCLCRFDVRDG